MYRPSITSGSHDFFLLRLIVQKFLDIFNSIYLYLVTHTTLAGGSINSFSQNAERFVDPNTLTSGMDVFDGVLERHLLRKSQYKQFVQNINTKVKNRKNQRLQKCLNIRKHIYVYITKTTYETKHLNRCILPVSFYVIIPFSK